MKTTLLFPMRGSPPAIQEGYTRDPGNAYVQHLIWIPCTARESIDLCKGCPGSSVSVRCNQLNKQVDQNVCTACGGVEALAQRASAKQPELLSIGVQSVIIHDILPELPIVPAPIAGDIQGQRMPYVHEDETDVAMPEVPDRDRSEDLPGV